jgi:hypothetical protein
MVNNAINIPAELFNYLLAEVGLLIILYSPYKLIAPLAKRR